MLESDQPFPSHNSLDKPTYNEYDSIDLYFSPNNPKGVPENNCLHGKAFIDVTRLYGAGTEVYNQTWKPDNIVTVK